MIIRKKYFVVYSIKINYFVFPVVPVFISLFLLHTFQTTTFLFEEEIFPIVSFRR